jgi:ribose transport system ATP-binding protein
MIVENDAAWLRAAGLTRWYGGILAVDDVAIAIRPGEVRGLIGANGAGKSTLVKMLTGQVRPSRGTITVDGEAVDLAARGQARAHGIELMPQELTILPNLSVAENVTLGCEPSRGGFIDAAQERARAREALTRIGAPDIDTSAPAGERSLVEQRLVMAARAVLSGSRLIVLDEPTAAMSPAEVALLMQMVRTLSEAGVACLYVSHRLDEIVELADGVTAMRDGRVVAELGPGEVTHAGLVELITVSAPVTIPLAGARSHTSEPVLEVRNLSRRTLRAATFDVRAGEIVGLAGLLSSGVDEVLNVLAGSHVPTGGTVQLHGVELPLGKRTHLARAGVGYLPGDRTLAALPNHRVRENVTVAGLGRFSRFGMSSAASERRGIGDALKRVGFTRDSEVTISTLSGGNQQKALLARWVLDRLQVLLLDDPTIGVDIGARAEIHAELRHVAAAGTAVLLYSSDLDELLALSDRVLVFDRGRCVLELEQPHVTEEEILGAMTGRTGLGASTPAAG